MFTNNYKLITIVLIVFQVKTAEVGINFALLPNAVTQEIIDKSKELWGLSPKLWISTSVEIALNDASLEYIKNKCDVENMSNNSLSDDLLRRLENRFVEHDVYLTLYIKVCSFLGGFLAEKRTHSRIEETNVITSEYFFIIGSIHLDFQMFYSGQVNFIRFLNDITKKNIYNKYTDKIEIDIGKLTKKKFYNQTIEAYLYNNFSRDIRTLIMQAYNLVITENSCCNIQ